MENHKYKAEDLIIAVVNVLHCTGLCYAKIAFRLAFKFHCTDLKGLVSTNGFDEIDTELIRSLEDPILAMIGQSIGQFQDTISLIAELYNIDREHLIDEEMVKLAQDFHSQTIIDGIPLDDRENDRISYDETLDLFALSLINVVNWLCILLQTGEADLSLSFDGNHSCTAFMDADYSTHQHAAGLGLLKLLGTHLHRQYFAIAEMH